MAPASSTEKAGRNVADNKHLAPALNPLVRRVRTDVTATKGPNGMGWTREALTPARLAKHLNGGPARGVCPIKAGESVTMVGLLDLDSHKGESTWQEMADTALRVVGELEARFMAPVCFRSSGGKGIHIYVLWDEPQDAYSVRQELTEAIGALGFTNGTAGVARGQIEVFPKQDRVPADGFGNQFILPLAGHSEPLEPLLGMEPMGKDAALALVWPSSAPVVVREKPVRERSDVVVEDLALLDRALFAIPNDDSTGPDRDGWFRLMCAYKEGGGDKETARSWTMQHSSYRDEAFDGPWESIKLGKDDGTPVGYLFTAAQRHGFTEHVVADFPVVEQADAAPGEPEPLPPFQRDKKGGVEATVTNTVLAVRRPDVVGLQVAYDEFRDEITVAQPGAALAWRPMTDADAVAIRMRMEAVGFKAAPKELARDACVLVAAENAYDSAKLWLGSLKHDGRARCETFLIDYMGCEDTPYVRAVALYMWSALAGRVIQPGVKADMVPIYEGDQGLRKSSSIEAISPAPEFFVELDFDKDEDDTVRSLRGALVGEVAELSGLHTRQIEWIKKFVVRKTEKWIPKYKEFATTFDRRLLFIGTTNRTDILADDTGNRRWLPTHVTKADVEGIVAAREQLWAEGAVLFKQHGVMWHEAERLAAPEHDKYTMEDAWESAVAAWLEGVDEFGEGAAPWKNRTFTTSDVLSGALRLSAKEQDRLAQKRVAAILKSFRYMQKTTRINGVPTRAWRNAEIRLCDAIRDASSVSGFS